MKTTLLSLLLLCSFVLTAQNSSRSVVESNEDNAYLFSVKLDKRNAEKLLPIYQELTETDLTIEGTAVTEWDNGLALSLNTKKGKLSVSHKAKDEEGRTSALEMVSLIKKRLNIVSPAPPKH